MFFLEVENENRPLSSVMAPLSVPSSNTEAYGRTSPLIESVTIPSTSMVCPQTADTIHKETSKLNILVFIQQ